MKRKTILVIEDNICNMKLVRSLMEIEGYNIIEAQTAEEGLELTRKHFPDLILMDIQLPGMDGLSATRQIRTDPEIKEIPVLALTAYAMKGDKQKAMDAGCSGYITKPLDKKHFLKTLKTHLSIPQSGRTKEIQAKKTDSDLTMIDDDLFLKSRILIVDDDPANVKLLKAKLSLNAFMTIEAFSGKECLNKAQKEHPDLILLDIMMPGIDGFEITRILKRDKTTRDIPIIHVTALDRSINRIRSLEAGADEFLNKPINTEELLTRIRSLLRLKKYCEQLKTRKESKRRFLSPEKQNFAFQNMDLKAAILVVDTNEKDVAFYEKNVCAYCSSLFITGSGKEALNIVESKPIDIVILDISLLDMDGYEVCRRLKKTDRTRNIQVMTITSKTDIKSKIRAIELGTDDYLIKPVGSLELKARIKSFIRKKVYLDILVAKYESAFHSAITDQLTNLYNHAFFKHYLELELTRALRQKHPLTLLIIDIDDFKQINDYYGHQEGDRILRKMGHIFRSSVREIDVCARYGGDEFAVVLPYADRVIGGMIAERLWKKIALIKNKQEKRAENEYIKVSIGISVCPQDALDVQGLIQKADMAMYQSKKNGKNRIIYSS